jgi:hypothetical protein
MAELDGAPACRVALAKLAKSEPVGNRPAGCARFLAKEFYTEIRAARIAGHGWKHIASEMGKALGRKVNPQTLNTNFAVVDREYERSTGVEALPVRDKRFNGNGKKKR